MHRLIASKERDVKQLDAKIEELRSEIETLREEKNVLQTELEALRQEKMVIQLRVKAEEHELLKFQHRVDRQEDSRNIYPSFTAHKAFVCDSSLSLSDSYQSFNQQFNWKGLSDESEDSVGLNSVLDLSQFKQHQLPSAEVLEVAVVSASLSSTNIEDPAEGRAASYILMAIYQEDYQMSLDFWTKLVQILALHELWADVEMLIGIATEQHPEFSPPVNVLETMVLRVLRFQKNPERELRKLKNLIGESQGLFQMSHSVKSRVRNLLMFPQQIIDDELHVWLASFTNWG